MTTNADLLVMSMRYEAEAREAIDKLRAAGEGEVWTTLAVIASRESDRLAEALRQSTGMFIGLKTIAEATLAAHVERADDAG